MATFTFKVGTPTATDVAAATAAVAHYAETNVTRKHNGQSAVAALLACVMYAIRTGNGVEVTDLTPAGGSALMSRFQSRLKHGAIRPEWDYIQVVPGEVIDQKGSILTIHRNTTATAGRTWIVTGHAVQS